MSDGSSSIVGGSKGSSKSKSRVDVPDFLQPFLNQLIGTSSGALSDLAQQTQGDQFADFNPLQQAAFGQAEGVAGGAGGFLPTAQNTFMNAAQGQDISEFLNPQALQALTGAAGGQGLEQFIPQNALTGLNQFATGDTSNPALQSLTNTANGDFLFGGQGFDEAVNASVRAAQPHILSTFGGAGPGGSTSGLAQTAIGKSAIDAFASQYGQERNRQQGAANSLGQFGLAGSNSLAGLGQNERGNALNSAGLLAGLGDNERNRQLGAAGALPDLGLAGSNILFGLGDRQQQQEQGEIDAPRDALLQLLMSSLGGFDLESLLGNTTKGKNNSVTAGTQSNG